MKDDSVTIDLTDSFPRFRIFAVFLFISIIVPGIMAKSDVNEMILAKVELHSFKGCIVK